MNNNIPFSLNLEKNIASGMSWSDDYQIGFVLKGKLRIRFKTRVREYLEHDLFFFAPFETWYVVYTDPGTYILKTRIRNAFFGSISPDVFRMSLSRHHLNADLSDPIYCRVCSALAIIIFNGLKEESTAGLKSLSAISDLLAGLTEAFGTGNEAAPNTVWRTDRNRDILKYIGEHYREKLTIGETAHHFGLHPQYFSSYFKKQFNMNFVDYLTHVRIGASLTDLEMTDKSILAIALDHGFANNKTYAAAFRKICGCTPGEYRKNSDASEILRTYAGLDKEDELKADIFEYFHNFIGGDREYNEPHSSGLQNTLELYPDILAKESFISDRAVNMSAGRAYACLRSNLQEQIIKAKTELNLRYLRIRDIFSDALYVYHEEAGKNPSFNWQALDEVFDFLLKNDITPFPELGFMPERMASRKQYAGFQYHPNVSQPRSLELWQKMISSFLEHYLERYGEEELRSWRFDFWTSPDLVLKQPYWYGSMEEFFEFYNATWEVFHSADEHLALGSPNFSIISGYGWYDAFFRFCRVHGIRPAFISIHIYGCTPLHNPAVPDSLETIDQRRFSVSNPGSIRTEIEKLNAIMNKYEFGKLPVIMADWNLSFLPRDLVRETCYMGPWICFNYVETLGAVSQLIFWSLSDIHEEAFPENRKFYGGPGALDYQGFRKASYNTFYLLGKLGAEILEKGSYYLLAKKQNVIQLLLFHLVEFDAMFNAIDSTVIDRTHRYHIYKNQANMVVRILLHLKKGEYLIKRWEVNRTSGSAYDLWAQTGFPENLNSDVSDYIEKTSVPNLTCYMKNVEETLFLEEMLPSHGVMLLEIIPTDN